MTWLTRMALDLQEKQYAALAPALSLAGVFIHPIASSLIPFAMFILYRYWQKGFAGETALRTADLAFSIQIWIMLLSLLLMLALSLAVLSNSQAQSLQTIGTVLILAYFVISLIIAGAQAFRGKLFQHGLSFRLAERIISALQKAKQNRLT